MLALLVSAGGLARAAVPGNGTFSSSDPLLNRIWAASVQTATDMVVPGPLTTDALGRPCSIQASLVVLDGTDRDRCPYIGDQAVTGMTLLTVVAGDDPALRSLILWCAENQHPDGAIPASPLNGGTPVLFDYNAFWIEDLYDYALYTGDLTLVRQVWPSVLALLNTWYPAQAEADGLLVNSLGPSDYAYIPRAGTVVAYYNAGYIRALREAATLAAWLGETAQSAGWAARLAPLVAAFQGTFWDPTVHAYKDTSAGPVVHPEDGNAFAILAGIATPAQARSALDYLTWHDNEPYGATIADNSVWDGYPWGFQASQRVYPFMSYFEVLARYQVGFAASGLSLIRREWGDMLSHGPGTMWETIGAGGASPTPGAASSDHGWSSGAAPLLTSEVLGVIPGTPGFGSYVLAPHPSGLAWAKGTIPTPGGVIAVSWSVSSSGFSLTVNSPVGGKVLLPVAGSVVLDGRPASVTASGQPGATVTVGPGHHVVRVLTTS